MDQFMRSYLEARVKPLLDLTATAGDPALAERGAQIAAQMEELAESCGDAGAFEARFAECGLMDAYNQAYVDAYMGGGTSEVLPEPDPNASTTPEFTAESVPAIRAEMAADLKRGLAEEAADTVGFEIGQAIKEELVYPVKRGMYEEMIHEPVIGDIMRAGNDLPQVEEAARLGKRLFGRRKRRKDEKG